MKKILTMTLAIAAICGFSMNAQTTNKDKAKAKTEAIAAKQNKMRQPVEFTEFAFEGILLEPAQQARMDSLNAAVKARQAEGKQCGKDNKCPKDQNCPKAENGSNDKKCDKAKCDSAQNCPKGKKDGKGPRPEMRGPKCPCACPEYMGKVKEILTPEQYTMFLENVVKYQANNPNMGMSKRDNRLQDPRNKEMRKRPRIEQRGDSTTVIPAQGAKAKASKKKNMVQAN